MVSDRPLVIAELFDRSDRTGGTDDRHNRIIRIQDESMVTRLAVDTELLQEAIESDSQATIETVVETALREYIRRRQQLVN